MDPFSVTVLILVAVEAGAVIVASIVVLGCRVNVDPGRVISSVVKKVEPLSVTVRTCVSVEAGAVLMT